MDDLCEGPQAFQAAGHSSSKATLPPKWGEQQAVLGWVGLVGTVRSAELLDGFVSRPRQLKGQVHPPLLVLGTPGVHSFTSVDDVEGGGFVRGGGGGIAWEAGEQLSVSVMAWSACTLM